MWTPDEPGMHLLPAESMTVRSGKENWSSMAIRFRARSHASVRGLRYDLAVLAEGKASV